MSSKNYVLAKKKENVLMGHSYDGKELIFVTPNLHETYTSTFFTPVSGGVGSNHRVDINLSIDDEFNINDVLLEFTQNNLDGTLSQTVVNPWLLMSECKVFINNQEVHHIDNMEKLFCTQAAHYRSLTDDEFKCDLQQLMPTSHSSPLSGETIAAGGSLTWSLPLLSVLFPFLKDISRSQGVMKLSFEFRFQPNTAVASTTLRYLSSSTTSNPYTSATISFTNIQARLVTTKHSDEYLRHVPNPIMVIEKYDDKLYPLSFNVVGASQRIQLSTEFSKRNIIHGIYVYLYDTSRITAYNDSDAFKTYSGADLVGWELKFKSRTIVKLDGSTDKGKRVKYYQDTHIKRHGKRLNHKLVDGSDNTGSYYVPLTFIDLQNVAINDNDTERVFSGLPNSGGELELIVSNASGAFSTAASLYIVLAYYEFASLNPKTGYVSWKR